MTNDDGRQTTDDRRRTTDDRRQATDDRRQTTDDRRQTTVISHRSSVFGHQSSVIGPPSSVLRHSYVASIRDFWRVCSGCEPVARARVEKFLHEVLNTKDFPLTVMDRPIESETTKIVENSYRATILAYLNEWSLQPATCNLKLET